MLESITLGHPYVLVFLGMILGGETIFVPAVYLALLGKFNVFYLVAIAMAANAISDSAWYAAGRFGLIHYERIPRFKKQAEFLSKIGDFFGNHGLRVVFYSKFIYGTRTIAQILSGAYRLPFFKFLFVNTLGVTAWTLFIAVAGIALNSGVGHLGTFVYGAEVLFLLFVGIIIGIHIFAKWFILKNRGVPKDPPALSEKNDV